MTISMKGIENKIPDNELFSEKLIIFILHFIIKNTRFCIDKQNIK